MASVRGERGTFSLGKKKGRTHEKFTKELPKRVVGEQRGHKMVDWKRGAKKEKGGRTSEIFGKGRIQNFLPNALKGVGPLDPWEQEKPNITKTSKEKRGEKRPITAKN